MTGLERLRDLAHNLILWKDVWSATNSDYCVRHRLSKDNDGGLIDKLLLDIADQIEREHLREADDISWRDADAIAWVESNGGVEECDRKVEASMEVADKYTLLRMELGKLLGYDLMGQLDASDEDLVEKIGKRLMPSGMEWLLDVWPKWSNGEYCKFGDWWKAEQYGEREPQQLRRLAFFTPEQLREWGQDEGENFGYEWDYMRPSDTTYRPDKVEPPAPKVLDADGVEIRVGDTVWHTKTGADYRVLSLPNFDKGAWVTTKTNQTDNLFFDLAVLTHRAPVLAADGKPLREGETVWLVKNGAGPYQVLGVTDGCAIVEGAVGTTPGEMLTHERPDSWERLKEDATRHPRDYCGMLLNWAIVPEQDDAHYIGGMASDLVRRAKKLAGVS